jgi:hypothetical protein
VTNKAFIADSQRKVRRFSPGRDAQRTAEAAPSTLKAQGDGDPLRISSSLQRVNMFMVSHFLFPFPRPRLSRGGGFFKQGDRQGSPCYYLNDSIRKPLFCRARKFMLFISNSCVSFV